MWRFECSGEGDTAGKDGQGQEGLRFNSIGQNLNISYITILKWMHGIWQSLWQPMWDFAFLHWGRFFFCLVWGCNLPSQKKIARVSPNGVIKNGIKEINGIKKRHAYSFILCSRIKGRKKCHARGNRLSWKGLSCAVFMWYSSRMMCVFFSVRKMCDYIFYSIKQFFYSFLIFLLWLFIEFITILIQNWKSGQSHFFLLSNERVVQALGSIRISKKNIYI